MNVSNFTSCRARCEDRVVLCSSLVPGFQNLTQYRWNVAMLVIPNWLYAQLIQHIRLLFCIKPFNLLNNAPYFISPPFTLLSWALLSSTLDAALFKLLFVLESV